MIRRVQSLWLMYATLDESQDDMTRATSQSFLRQMSRSRLIPLGFIGLSLWFCDNAVAQQAPANPLRAVTDFMNITTEAGEGADFVKATRPDRDKMEYAPLIGAEKKRVPVKTPAEVAAAQADLAAKRSKAGAQRQKLEGVKMEPVQPAKPAPYTDEHF